MLPGSRMAVARILHSGQSLGKVWRPESWPILAAIQPYYQRTEEYPPDEYSLAEIPAARAALTW